VSLFLTVLHVMACLVLIVVVLLQRGKGAEIGAVFGGGGSSTVFGSRGAGNFLTKLTTGSAVVFMLTSLWLSALGSSSFSGGLFGGDETNAPAAESPFAEPKQDGAGTSAPAAESTAPATGGFAEPTQDGAPPAPAAEAAPAPEAPAPAAPAAEKN